MVIIEVEPDVDHLITAKLQHRDLRVVRSDLERAGDVDGEAEHPMPVVIVLLHDASRLIQHKNDVERRTSAVVGDFYTTPQTQTTIDAPERGFNCDWGY